MTGLSKRYFNFLKNKNLFKIKLLIISILIFSVLYSFLNDSHFRGLNVIEDQLENKLTEKQLNKDIKSIHKENFYNNTHKKIDKILEKNEKDYDSINDSDVEKIKKIKQVDETVKDKKLLQPLYVRYYNRLYFTIVTACLLGYGDIYPYTFICKLFAMLQGLITVSIIVF
tara:strand:- start:385 stop:894 length:510 start_codon:yes stop_codon:yes gene_type:complete